MMMYDGGPHVVDQPTGFFRRFLSMDQLVISCVIGPHNKPRGFARMGLKYPTNFNEGLYVYIYIYVFSQQTGGNTTNISQIRDDVGPISDGFGHLWYSKMARTSISSIMFPAINLHLVGFP